MKKQDKALLNAVKPAVVVWLLEVVDKYLVDRGLTSVQTEILYDFIKFLSK